MFEKPSNTKFQICSDQAILSTTREWGFDFPLWAELFLHIFQIDYGTHAASCPEITRGSLHGVRAALA